MVLPSTVILTMDNSGARRVKCIKIYKKPGRGFGIVGDLVKVIVLRLRNRGHIRVKLGEIHIAVITRDSSTTLRVKRGFFLKFDYNSVVLLNKKRLPIGTRVFGPCAVELRKKGFLRVITLSSVIL